MSINIYKDSKAEYDKLYREKYKDLITEKNKRLYTCVCGKKSTIHNKLRHQKSIRHNKIINK
jgi:hypothetical protein